MRSLTILQLNDLHGYLTPHPELFRLAPNDRFRSGGGVKVGVIGVVARHLPA